MSEPEQVRSEVDEERAVATEAGAEAEGTDPTAELDAGMPTERRPRSLSATPARA